MKCWPVVCLIAGAVATAAAAEVSVAELAPPGTKVVAGINVRGLLNSSLAKEIGTQERDLAAKFTAKGNLTGFDPFKDLDQVFVFLTGTDDKALILAVARGRFEVETLAHGARRYKDIPVIGDGAGSNPVFAVLNAETAIIGKKAQVEAAIDQLGTGAHLDAELKDRIEVAGSRYEIWGIGEIPEGVKVSASGLSPSSIDRFMFGLALRQGLGLTAEVHARATEDAARLTAVLGILGAALKGQKKDSGVAFDVQSENGTFRIALTVPESELIKVVQEQRKSLVDSLSKRAGGPAGSATATPGEARPAPSKPAKPVQKPALISPLPAIVAPPPLAPKPATQPEIIKAPDGDTVVVRLPGAR